MTSVDNLHLDSGDRESSTLAITLVIAGVLFALVFIFIFICIYYLKRINANEGGVPTPPTTPSERVSSSLSERDAIELTELSYNSRNSIPFDQRSCLICLDNFEMDEELFSFACGHVFHRSCLFTAILYGHEACPQCRGT